LCVRGDDVLIKRVVAIVSMVLVLTLLFVSCGASSTVTTGGGGGKTASGEKGGGIVVKTPAKDKHVIASLLMIKDKDGRYVVTFYVENNTDKPYEYTANNGCIVGWHLYKKNGDSWEKVKLEPRKCTQQMIFITVEPGDKKEIESYKLPPLEPGTYNIMGTMEKLSASKIFEVK